MFVFSMELGGIVLNHVKLLAADDHHKFWFAFNFISCKQLDNFICK